MRFGVVIKNWLSKLAKFLKNVKIFENHQKSICAFEFVKKGVGWAPFYVCRVLQQVHQTIVGALGFSESISKYLGKCKCKHEIYVLVPTDP